MFTIQIVNRGKCRCKKNCTSFTRFYLGEELIKTICEGEARQISRDIMRKLYEFKRYEYKRDSSMIKTWSTDETKELIRLYFENLPYTSIAKTLNRSTKSIERKIQNLRKQNKLIKE